MSFAAATGARRGSRPKVTRPVRWDHSHAAPGLGGGQPHQFQGLRDVGAGDAQHQSGQPQALETQNRVQIAICAHDAGLD